MNEIIFNLAKSHNYNITELAQILNISPAAISQWNTKNINIENLDKIATLFNISIDELINNKFNEDQYRYRFSIADKKNFLTQYLLNPDTEDIASDNIKYINKIINRFQHLYIKKLKHIKLTSEDILEFNILKNYFENPNYEIKFNEEYTDEDYKWLIINNIKFKKYYGLDPGSDYTDFDINTDYGIKCISIVDPVDLDAITTATYKMLIDRLIISSMTDFDKILLKLHRYIKLGGRIVKTISCINIDGTPKNWELLKLNKNKMLSELFPKINDVNSLKRLTRNEYLSLIDEKQTKYYYYRATHNEKDSWNYYKELYNI